MKLVILWLWADAGPGALRGLDRLTGRPLDYCLRSRGWND